MENVYILTSDGELYHWGVKGMKWGVRRYQNKDGSLTEAGRKRLAENVAKNVEYTKDATWNSKRQRWDVFNDSPSHTQNNVSKIPEVQKAFKELKGARDEYYKAFKIAGEFNNDSKLVKKYQEKAARLEAERMGIRDEQGIKNVIWGYQNADFDQGNGNSFSIYLKDKGINESQYYQSIDNASAKYKAACREYTERLLGEYGDKTVYTYSNGEKTTVTDIVDYAIETLTDNDRYFNRGFWVPS